MSKKLKFIIVVLLVLILGLIAWGLISSIRAKISAREARIRQVENAKLAESKITLIEGWTNDEIFSYIEKQNVTTKPELLKAESNINASDYAFLQDKPKKADLQGFLFPDTYKVAKTGTADSILFKLLNTFEQKFSLAASGSSLKAGYYQLSGYENLNLKNRVSSGLTVYDVVTLASIVERETGKPGENASSSRLQTERQTVAGIFLNRLEAGQALQSDATVNFITKAGLASPTLDQTKIDSLYNTYKYTGLPPGPIGNPSYSSLYAVLHPIKSDYLYFLHSQPEGVIYYAKTLDEHNKNKAKYLK